MNGARDQAERAARGLTPTQFAALQNKPGWTQSLANGAAGIALFHIERARSQIAPWGIAHSWLSVAASHDISALPDVGLYNGAPALAFVLRAASAGPGHYETAITHLDRHVANVTHQRVSNASARIDRGELPRFDEYDLIYGLTGIGAYLLRHNPHDGALERVLSYLVRLTHPIHSDHGELPGWWTAHDPFLDDQSRAFRHGHANLGMAHGIAGPLALLSLAKLQGTTVDGHDDALGAICAWLDTWRQNSGAGTWWPQWITLSDLRSGHPGQTRPRRPSWCYGTPGLARAQQLAAIATADRTRQQIAEQALIDCLSDPAQVDTITDPGLCHGWAGIYQTAHRAAQDSATAALAGHAQRLMRNLIQQKHDQDEPGLLDGRAGLALALHTAAATQQPPSTGWDSCLLIA